MSTEDELSEYDNVQCAKCGTEMIHGKTDYQCGACNEHFCSDCIESVPEGLYPELWLTYDFYEQMFCVKCMSELHNEVSNMCAEEKAHALASKKKFDDQFNTFCRKNKKK